MRRALKPITSQGRLMAVAEARAREGLDPDAEAWMGWAWQHREALEPA